MRKLNVVFLVLALVLLVYFLHRVGWGRIGDGFARVGWGFVVPLGIFVGQFLIETWNFGRCFRQSPPYRNLLLPYWCGQGINLLTPTGSLGEATKAGMLAGVVSSEAAVSALVIYNLAFTYALVVILLLAASALWLLPEAPAALRWTGTLVAVGMLAGLLAFHRGITAGLVSRLLVRLSGSGRRAWLVRASEHVARSEHEVRAHASDLPLRFAQVVAVVVASQSIPIVELWATWKLLGVDLSLAQCFIFGGVDTLVRIVFAVVPGNVGVAEGSSYVASGLLSLDPGLGLMRQLIARCVRLCFAVPGALVLAWLTLRPARRAGAGG
jgi:hypothetical protein